MQGAFSQKRDVGRGAVRAFDRAVCGWPLAVAMVCGITCALVAAEALDHGETKVPCTNRIALQATAQPSTKFVLGDLKIEGLVKALARRRSAAALDRHRTLGSREEVPTHQRLSRNPVAEGTPESVAPSAEGGQEGRSCLKLVVRKAYSAEHRESLLSTKTRTSSNQVFNSWVTRC